MRKKHEHSVMGKVRIIFLFYFLFLLNFLWAQTDVPNIIPPSPQASNLIRYKEYPVDHSTGIPQISIDLFQIETPKFSFPLRISYHSSGNKVNDVASEVGLGWTINSSGSVTKTELDRPDDISPKATYKTRAAMQNARYNVNMVGYGGRINLATEFLMDANSKDKLADRFFFTSPDGSSSVFRYDYLTDSLLVLPFRAINIDKKYNSSKFISEFVITEENGTRLFFKPVGSVGEGIWALRNMISADQTDTISFVYHPNISNVSWTHTRSYEVISGVKYRDPFSRTGNPEPYDEMIRGSKDDSGVYYLVDSIITKTSFLKFSYIKDRSDNAQYRLKEITMTDRSTGELIKKVIFNNDVNFGTKSTNKRLKLSGITCYGSDLTKGEDYSFLYDESMELPSYDAVRTGNNQDYWGYYNGEHTYEPTGIPREFFPLTGSYSNMSNLYKGDLNPDANYAKAYLIKEIRFPTGGSTKFEFEPNYVVGNPYDYPAQFQFSVKNYVGGFRIKAIKNYSSDGDLSFIKSYNYEHASFRTITSEAYSIVKRVVDTYELIGPQVGTAYVASRLELSSSPNYPLTLTNGAPVIYGKVTEFNGTSDSNTGKTEFVYETPSSDYADNYGRTPMIHPIDNGTYSPKILSKTVYEYKNGEYKPIKRSNYFYTAYKASEFHEGIGIFMESRHNDFTGIRYGMIHPTPPDVEYYLGLSNYIYDFDYYEYKSTPKIDLLSKVEEISYYDGQNIVSTVKYDYENHIHLQKTKETKIDSKGDTLISVIKYPHDFIGVQPYTNMVSKHLWSPIVENKLYKNTISEQNFIKSDKTNYAIFNGRNNQIYIQSFETIGSDGDKSSTFFHSYDDQGNITSYSNNKGPIHSFLYSRWAKYPVAHVVNSGYNDIGFTGFENGDLGNWTWNGVVVKGNSNSHEGENYLQLSTGQSISKTGLDPLKQYRVSVWLRGIMTPPNGYVAVSKKGNWTNCQKTVSGLTTFTFSYSESINGMVDNISICPVDASMTTYQYKPLGVLKSKTDPRGITAYYKYDSMQRLQVILDHLNNVNKSFNYHFRSN